MWTSQVEVPSNVDTAHIGRYLATLEGTSGTLQVCRYPRTLTYILTNHLTLHTLVLGGSNMQQSSYFVLHHCLILII